MDLGRAVSCLFMGGLGPGQGYLSKTTGRMTSGIHGVLKSHLLSIVHLRTQPEENRDLVWITVQSAPTEMNSEPQPPQHAFICLGLSKLAIKQSNPGPQLKPDIPEKE